MEELVKFALLGLGTGALYALASQGLIVIYRGSGVLNFAIGAIGMAAAFLQWDLMAHGWGYWPSLLVGVAFAAAIGALTHVLIMRPLRAASPLARVIATLGLLVTLQALAVLRYGASPQFVVSQLPTTTLHIHGSIVITADRLILFGIAAGLTVALWLLYRFTTFGLSTSAVAENERAAAALGWSANSIAGINWTLGCGLAGLAGILITPVLNLQVAAMTNLILAALAAALIAQFRSFPIALAAGVGVGIAQSEVSNYVSQPGWSSAVPFLVVIGVLLVTGKALPLRDFFLQRMPSIGTGRFSWSGVAFAVAVTAVLVSLVSAQWIAAITVTLCAAFVLLSVVVVTGYAGQISLAQFALAGFGAWVAGRLVATQGTPFWLALPIGVAVTVPVGVLFAIPAVRSRGISLAVVTLGLGTALELVLFNNPSYTGGIQGTQVGSANLFGWAIDPIAHPTRYALFALALLVLCSAVAANIRRGRTGRRLIAVRTNERAAAAMGVGVGGAKLYAFGVGAGIAAIGGILLAFQSTSIDYTQFTTFTSVTYVGLALVGGIGYLLGPVIGALLVAGGLSQQILTALFSEGIGRYIQLIGGISIIVLVLFSQNGLAPVYTRQFAPIRDRLLKRLRRRKPAARAAVLLEADRAPVARKQLDMHDLTVKYGRHVAVDSVSLTVVPGRVTGLIGANGAGKTTLIDAVTGFSRPAGGTITLDGQSITTWSAARRARGGIARSFQSLELLDDSSVLENLRVASDPRDARSYLTDLVWPVNPALPGAAVSAIKEFGLGDDLDVSAEELSYGKRRLLAIARAVASEASVLLLDEPAAGLGDVETAELAHLIRRLADEWGMGILLIEHDVNFVMSVCDEVLALDFGRVIAAGTPDAVRRDPRVVAAYLGTEDDADAGAPEGKAAMTPEVQR